MKTYTLTAIATLTISSIASSHEGTTGTPDAFQTARPDSHAPIGVMGDHTHNKGEWMASYRYMFMAMQQSMDGDSTISDSSILIPGGGQFRVTPTEMDMEMHMLGIMYAPTDKLTLMGMLTYAESSMSHITAMGGTFKTRSSGWSDASITALYKFHETKSTRAHFGLGLQLPTGDNTERDDTPLGNTRLPYPMQPGSGNWAILPSLTFNGQADTYSYGAQIKAKIYVGKNDEGYRLGNRYEATTWIAKPLTKWASASLRLKATHQGNIKGSDNSFDDAVDINLVPTVFTNLRGGTKIDLIAGINLWEPTSGARLAFEIGKPIYQNLDGPQLSTDWFATVGIQYAF